LADIAAQTGATIIPDESVVGTVTLDLKDKPLRDALRMVFMAGGYVFDEVEPGVYLATSPDPKAPAFQKIARTEVVALKYISSEELTLLLPDLHARFAKLDKVGNRVTVTAPPELLRATIAQIEALDRAPQQIMIEALVMEANRDTLKQFEISLQGEHLGVSTGVGLMTYIGQAEALLHQLLWLSEKRKATIRANPRVVAQEGQQANVKVGVEQYFQLLTGRIGFETYTLEAVEAAISLTITPHVAEGDGRITCAIQAEVGDVTGTGANNLPIITRRAANTTIRIGDGEVIALGGLLQDTTRRVDKRIPLLGDLPLIGSLFRSHDVTTAQREIVIFLVPHLLDEQGRFVGPLLTDRLAPVDAPPPKQSG
jgi:type IV pilus assembly protein PilQ